MTRIPAELRDRRQWVVWRYEERDGERTKVLCQVREARVNASSTNPATWGSYEDATRIASTADWADGYGYVFSEDDPYAGVDLDKCITDGVMSEVAAARILQFATYTEYSPSGTGVHLILRGAVPGPRRKSAGVEMYHRARYFTMTGQVVPGTLETIEDRQEQLVALYKEVFPEPPSVVGSSNPLDQSSPIGGDADLIERAMRARGGAKFRDLWEGNWQTGYASQSELWQPLLDHHVLSPYNAPEDFVFATSSGSPIDGRNALRWFKDAAKAAGITRRVWIHQLRHTAGTRAAEVGLTALEVAAMLGHAQASTSERYIHLAAGAGQERADLIAAKALGDSRLA
jgi:hypothetical protein